MTISQTPPASAAASVEQRLDQLRRLAEEDLAAARHWAWGWFHELGGQVTGDRRAALRELNELFRLGTPPGDDLDGPTEGILVTTTVSPAAERGSRAVAGAWMPWLGKRFSRAESVGYNRLTPGARLPSKLLWPRYAMWEDAGTQNAFRFLTRIEAGADDPDRQVLVLDYESVDENPSLVIRKIRDELVQIVPGAYLGKVLWRRKGAGYALIGYFALRLPG
jgi:hypothetical protein